MTDTDLRKGQSLAESHPALVQWSSRRMAFAQGAARKDYQESGE